MNIKNWILFYCLFFVITANAQESRELTMSMTDVVNMAQQNAPSSKIAKTRLKNNEWQYKSFLADYKPQVTLDATLPNLNRSIQPILKDDGSYDFVSSSFFTNSVNVSLSQVVTQTGGRVFASTSLERIDLFSPIQEVTYLSTPISIGFMQPFFGFNSLKWNKKIEPLRYNEAERAYSENMEFVANQSVTLFFDVLIAQLSVEAATKDKANADTLYRLSQGRFNVGKIAETELLQMETSMMNADASLARATLDLQTSSENLRNYLGIKDVVTFNLIAPSDIPDFQIDAVKALESAKKHRSDIVAFERRLLEAEQEVERADKETGLQLNLTGSLGLSQSNSTLGGAYSQPLDQERITLGIQMPIMDWGRAEARRQIATSNQELVKMNVEQDEINFERNILLKVQQFDLIRKQVILALKNYEISQKTYDLSQKRYLIGKISITDLNIALRSQDSNRQGYMSALRSFWTAYYEIRRLTLYDFMNDVPLVK